MDILVRRFLQLSRRTGMSILLFELWLSRRTGMSILLSSLSKECKMQIAKCKLQLRLKWVFPVLLGISGLLIIPGCAKVHSDQPRKSEAISQEERWDGALAAAARFLIDHQDADGAWRSD